MIESVLGGVISLVHCRVVGFDISEVEVNSLKLYVNVASVDAARVSVKLVPEHVVDAELSPSTDTVAPSMHSPVTFKVFWLVTRGLVVGEVIMMLGKEETTGALGLSSPLPPPLQADRKSTAVVVTNNL